MAGKGGLFGADEGGSTVVGGLYHSVGSVPELSGSGHEPVLGPADLVIVDKVENLHLADSIDTESSSTRGRSVWIHSTLLDSSVPAEEGGAVGIGVARSLVDQPL